jgi:hypothetical protein
MNGIKTDKILKLVKKIVNNNLYMNPKLLVFSQK